MEARTALARIGAGHSQAAAATSAVREACATVREDLDGADVDLAWLFLSPHHLDEVEAAVEELRSVLRPAHLLGCVAEGVVGRDRELQEGPAVAVWAGSLPGADLHCFHSEAIETEEAIAITGIPEFDEPALVAVLACPFTFPAASFLAQLNEDYPGVPIVGGIAGGGGEPGAQALILNDEVHVGGMVGAVVSGVPVLTVVSQGCAPIGRDAVITAAEGNVIHELAGEPALERLRDEIAGLGERERALSASGVLAGLVIDENKSEYGRGDYLMRMLLGADDETGAIAVGEAVRVGQTLRFHVRDETTANEDLRESLERVLGNGARPLGALLFTCSGRGSHMFSELDHDAKVLAEAIGQPAVAGFFCGGEIGPVGGRAFLHGFTATLAVFLEP